MTIKSEEEFEQYMDALDEYFFRSAGIDILHSWMSLKQIVNNHGKREARVCRICENFFLIEMKNGVEVLANVCKEKRKY